MIQASHNDCPEQEDYSAEQIFIVCMAFLPQPFRQSADKHKVEVVNKEGPS